MKRGTKVFLCLLSVVLATLIVAACIYCGYYPHYKRNQHAAVIADKPLERGEMRIMSCNLRCANTSDLGKTSWFYRADLIVKNIEAEAPTIIGFQEATKWQYNYMCRTLTGYDSVMTFRDDTLIVAFVKHGLGVTISQELAMQAFANNVEIRPLVPESFRTIGLAFARTASSVTARTLLEYLQANLCGA